jgi:DNA-3-methyladenine glycosylase
VNPSEPLPRSFYERSVLVVARAMIGCIVVHRSDDGYAAGRIIETEAYRGPEDQAAHSFGGRRTPRTEAMWGSPGHAYMFQLYGMHWAFNAVVAAAGRPHAVLVRALEPVEPLACMAERRSMEPSRRELTNGPGKLCAALGLNRHHYGADLTDGDLFLTPGARGSIGRSPRINIDYAGAWVDKPWRFYERGNRYVSVRPRD